MKIINTKVKMVTVDLAISTKEASDYTVAIVFELDDDNNVFIIDILRVKVEPSKHLKLIKGIIDKHSPTLIGIENVQYQASLIQNALELGYPVVSLKADRDKVTRSLQIAALVEAGKVYFPRSAHWSDDFEAELLSFPNGKHDDQVDAFAYITQMIHSRSNITPSSVKKVPSALVDKLKYF